MSKVFGSTRYAICQGKRNNEYSQNRTHKEKKKEEQRKTIRVDGSSALPPDLASAQKKKNTCP
jgi:hypothetical protein